MKLEWILRQNYVRNGKRPILKKSGKLKTVVNQLIMFNIKKRRCSIMKKIMNFVLFMLCFFSFNIVVNAATKVNPIIQEISNEKSRTR